jgi:glucose-6-phosphate-specific signal transduction histidine kinase
MEMKRWILFLLFILALQISYKIAPVLAQEDKDTWEIKKVIEKFTESLAYQDLDSAMSQFSIDYSCTTCSDAKDYNTLKSVLQKRMNDVLKTYTNFSTSELRLNNLNIQDNNATIEIECSWKGFNLDTLKEDSGKLQRSATLAKENGVWKITQWKPPQQSE